MRTDGESGCGWLYENPKSQENNNPKNTRKQQPQKYKLSGRLVFTFSLPRGQFAPLFLSVTSLAMIYCSVVQLQARGPHVALHSVFSGLRNHSGRICKSEICWKAYKVTFVSLNCLRWIKCICTRTINTTFSVYHFYLFIYFAIKLEGTAGR